MHRQKEISHRSFCMVNSHAIGDSTFDVKAIAAGRHSLPQCQSSHLREMLPGPSAMSSLNILPREP
ncbi:hypothetical protein KIN20_027405 [Parelaphostrongylus tenuis]|uniref:Uncharacterized protein n=1 Tax=Parelaphostrongylus tenuis TaxID=148309 RepID=A0AAD5QZP0_PARTN|nr:hypothetical protein KIN20_027405 [Parelaphostrongylus tenuis]